LNDRPTLLKGLIIFILLSVSGAIPNSSTFLEAVPFVKTPFLFESYLNPSKPPYLPYPLPPTPPNAISWIEICIITSLQHKAPLDVSSSNLLKLLCDFYPI